MKWLLLLLVPSWVLAQTAQLDITGNLVNNTATATTTTSTWQNVVFDTALQCWEPGGPGNCGPKPTFRPDGNINFSYGLTDIWQKVNVAKALPYGGSGLVTTGFVFGWTSKNGNGWDDGRVDQLDAYVKLYSSNDAKVLESFNWNLNYQHDWTIFTHSVNWANTKLGYRENQLGNVQYGFIGKDNNFWAGTYGPEIMGVTFQLKYKPDPCKNNPLFSPECPNFTEELQKANAINIPDSAKPPPPEEDRERKYDERIAKLELEDGMKEDGASEYYYDIKLELALTKIFEDQAQQEQRSLETAQTAVEQTQQVSDKVTKQAEAIARDSQQRSIRESLELKPEMLGQTQQRDRNQDSVLGVFQGPNTSTSVTAFTLPGVQVNQFSLVQSKDIGQPQQSANVSVQAIQQPTQSISILPASSRTSQEQQVTSTASNAMQTAAVTTYNQQQVQPIQQQHVIQQQQQLAIKPPQLNSVVDSVTQTNNTIPSTLQIAVEHPQAVAIVQPVILLSSIAPVVTQDLPQQNTIPLANPANPISDIINSKVEVAEAKQDTKSSSVQTKTEDSELAGGVSINSIARTPVDFTSYMVALADVQFYSVREIYRNQRVVDNQRALRQLGTDRLHQQMIELQYRSR